MAYGQNGPSCDPLNYYSRFTFHCFTYICCPMCDWNSTAKIVKTFRFHKYRTLFYQHILLSTNAYIPVVIKLEHMFSLKCDVVFTNLLLCLYWCYAVTITMLVSLMILIYFCNLLNLLLLQMILLSITIVTDDTFKNLNFIWYLYVFDAGQTRSGHSRGETCLDFRSFNSVQGMYIIKMHLFNDANYAYWIFQDSVK